MGAIDSAASCSQRASDLASKIPFREDADIHDHCLLAFALVLFAKDKVISRFRAVCYLIPIRLKSLESSLAAS
jgi:hypothetical protein